MEIIQYEEMRNVSGREYNNPTDEYSKQIEYQNVYEYGSQPKYEYNENSSSEETTPPSEKSKFKKMMQYFVAGVAGAVIVINSALAPSTGDGIDNIILELEYDTYMYTLEPGNTYKMTFDESKKDDYYTYVAEYVYKMTKAIDMDTYKQLLTYTSDDWNEADHLNNKLLYKVPDEQSYRTSSGNFGLINVNGKLAITTAYQYISFGEYDYSGDYRQYCGFVSVDLEDDENLHYLDKMIQTYGGKSKEEIYSSLIGKEISEVSGYFFQSYDLRDGASYIGERCEKFSEDETFYVKGGTQEVIVPTFLKIEKIGDRQDDSEEQDSEVVIIDGKNLSSQSYEYAKQITDVYYIVKENGLYGVVDFDGNEIIPIAYQSYSIVGEDEIEFTKDKMGSVYSTDTGQLLFEYAKEEEVARQYVETIAGPDGEHIITIAKELNPEYDGNIRLYRTYQGGLFCEEVSVVDDYEESEEDLFGYINRDMITYKDASTGEVLYRGYSGSWLYGMEDGYDGPQFQFSMSLANTQGCIIEYDLEDGAYYLVTVNKQSLEKRRIDKSFYQGKKRYYDEWLVMPYTAIVVNIDTSEIYTMPYRSEEIKQWYYGKDEYYGLGRETEDGSLIYAICKKDTILIDNCKEIGFIDDTYMAYSLDGKEQIIVDYNFNEICKVRDYTGFINGTALVYDGIGIYVVNHDFMQISDYIYKGTITNCTYGVVQLADKYYLLKTTE